LREEAGTIFHTKQGAEKKGKAPFETADAELILTQSDK